MAKKLPKKSNDQEGRNLLIWLAVSFVSWYVYITGGGAVIGLWADLTLIAVMIWIFRYVWQSRRPLKGWNASSVSAGLIALFLCVMWLVVVGVLYSALPKSSYFN
jgi:hypothetical protein